MRISTEKTKPTNLRERDSFQFVGFEFQTKKVKGTWKIDSYPPAAKMESLFKKLKETMPNSNPKSGITGYMNAQLQFIKANQILRGWLNFYRTGNSSKHFGLVKFKVFHIDRKYLELQMTQTGKYRDSKKEKKTNRTRLYQEMWDKYLHRYPNSNENWFGIPPSLSANKGRYAKMGLTLWLVHPGKVEVGTPSIIESNPTTGKLNAYHPDDQKVLVEKSLYWKWGLRNELLRKTKGLCPECQIEIVSLGIPHQIHHILPVSEGGSNRLANLTILCRNCHTQKHKSPIKLDQSALIKTTPKKT